MTRLPWTPADLFAIKLPADVQLAPGGDRVLYVETTIAHEQNEYHSRIWLAEPGRVRPITAGKKRDRAPRWSPDGSAIAFLTERSGSAQLWLLPAAGGEARQLTRLKGLTGEPVWSPDGRSIAVLVKTEAATPEAESAKAEAATPYERFTKGIKVVERLQYRTDGIGYHDGRRTRLALVDAATGEARFLTDAANDVSEPAWSPDGRLLAFVRSDSPDWSESAQVWVVPAEGGEPRQVTAGRGPKHSPAFSPDGGCIAYAGHDYRHIYYTRSSLFVIPAAGGEARELTPGFEGWVGEAPITDTRAAGGSHRPVWSADGAFLYFSSALRGTQQLYRVDAAGGVVEPVTAGEHCIYGWSFNRTQTQVAMAIATGENPGDIYLGAPGSEPHRLTAVNEALLAERATARAERFTYAGEGGVEVDAWLLHPAVQPAPAVPTPGAKSPLVVEVHGGPMGQYGAQFLCEFQLLASAGYAVLFTNPRGSTGRGQAFCSDIMGDWGKLDWADLMLGVDAALARFPWLDGDRMGIAGGSYGGFMVNWAVSHTNRFKGAVTMRSVVNRFSDVLTDDLGFTRIAEHGGVAPWEDPQRYLAMSPIMYADKIQTPLLIFHQEEDFRCCIEQADQLYTALKYLGRTVKFIRFPGEGHGMSRNGKPYHRLYRLEQILSWFQTHI
jgi:dipeptidyl aminopeptidase/acylaminoacyl peptidase